MKREKALILQRIPMVCMAFLIAMTDQLIKWHVENQPCGRIVFRLESVFEIVHTVNKGAAFSVLSGKTDVILAATTCMLLLLAAAVFAYPNISQAARWSMTVLLGGGIGNWLDRIRIGGVTDYIRVLFLRFPVFNLADICITVSVFAIVLLLLANRFEKTMGEKHGTEN